MKPGDKVTLKADEDEGFPREVVTVVEVEANGTIMAKDEAGELLEFTEDQIERVRGQRKVTAGKNGHVPYGSRQSGGTPSLRRSSWG